MDRNFRNTKAPEVPGAFVFAGDELLHSGHVCSLEAFRPLGDFKRYSIAFSKGFESVTRNGGKMTKHVFTIFLLKKTKPLTVVEPFYRTVYHVCTFS